MRRALEKEGWTITHDSYYIPVDDTTIQIDLAAETPIAAEKDNRRIAVEIKSFLRDSLIVNLQPAIGQYGVYRTLMRRHEPERTLYLALPQRVQERLLSDADYRAILREMQVRLIFYEPDEEVLSEWIETENIAP